MTLNLDINKLAGPGRLPARLDAEVVRPITEADLELMQTMPAQSKPPALKKITDRHHGLARLLASGVSEGEAALIVGYDQSRVSTLKNSPAFKELLALYQQKTQREHLSILEHMSGLSRDALVELRDRLEETPEKFSNNELTKISSEFIDRTNAAQAPSDDLPVVIELVAPDGAAKEEEEDSDLSTNSTSS